MGWLLAKRLFREQGETQTNKKERREFYHVLCPFFSQHSVVEVKQHAFSLLYHIGERRSILINSINIKSVHFVFFAVISAYEMSSAVSHNSIFHKLFHIIYKSLYKSICIFTTLFLCVS